MTKPLYTVNDEFGTPLSEGCQDYKTALLTARYYFEEHKDASCVGVQETHTENPESWVLTREEVMSS